MTGGHDNALTVSLLQRTVNESGVDREGDVKRIEGPDEARDGRRTQRDLGSPR